MAYTEDDNDTTGNSVEVYVSEEYPDYDYSDITDSEEEPESTRQTNPASNHMDVTIRKQFVDVDEIKRKVDADANTIQKQLVDMVGQMKGKSNSGHSSGVSCLLLILTLTVHWIFVRFSMSRRPRPRRVIQIRRRPAHLH